MDGTMCSHFRLYKKVPIYSYTYGNDRDLSSKQCSSCYLNENTRSKYNLVVVGEFMRNNCDQLNMLCSSLETEFIYYHKIDKDNIKDEQDYIFLTRIKKMKDKLKDEQKVANEL